MKEKKVKLPDPDHPISAPTQFVEANSIRFAKCAADRLPRLQSRRAPHVPGALR